MYRKEMYSTAMWAPAVQRPADLCNVLHHVSLLIAFEPECIIRSVELLPQHCPLCMGLTCVHPPAHACLAQSCSKNATALLTVVVHPATIIVGHGIDGVLMSSYCLCCSARSIKVCKVWHSKVDMPRLTDLQDAILCLVINSKL